jgi:hypothetical protein
MALGNLSHHRTYVSAIHLFHDYRSQDDGALEDRPVPDGVAVAAVEMVLRLHQAVYAPFYALFLVGPTAMLLEMWMDSRRARLMVAHA